jgi:site-specific recombinase XerD
MMGAFEGLKITAPAYVDVAISPLNFLVRGFFGSTRVEPFKAKEVPAGSVWLVCAGMVSSGEKAHGPRLIPRAVAFRLLPQLLGPSPLISPRNPSLGSGNILVIGSQIIPVESAAGVVQPYVGELRDLADAAVGFANANRSAATERAYLSDWADFSRWADAHQLVALPAQPETVALYLTHLAATHRPSTIGRRVASISIMHRRNGFDTPTTSPAVREVLKGIRRTLKTAQRQAAPATIGEIRRIVAHLSDDLLASRDRALLLVGFAGALRRSELVALDLDDLCDRPEGIVATVRCSKTDQEGEGRDVAIPYGRDSETCPVTALRTWLGRSAISAGPVFRSVDRHGNVSRHRLSDRAVALMVKRRVREAGLDPTSYSGHSLRAGFATTAAANGATERAIATQTGHQSMEVLRRYIRMGTIWSDNAASSLGL